MNLTDEQLANELYCAYQVHRTGCAKEVHAEMWDFINPYERSVWLSTARDIKSLLVPTKQKKAERQEA